MVKTGSDKTVICRYKDDDLFVRVVGDGKKKILAFHGYGQTGAVFHPLVHPGSTLYAFDLFYHGKSSHPESATPLSHLSFKKLMLDFFRQTHIKKFDVVGFSMGGKYALSLVESFPEMVTKLVLIAPDGVKKNFWYRMATGNPFSRWFFKYLAHHPETFFNAAVFLEKSQLIDGRLRKFALSQMNSQTNRKRVYTSWVFLRKFFVNPAKIARTINKHQIPTKIVLGRYDRIITLEYVKPLLSRIGRDTLEMINSGHTNILSAYLEKLRRTSHNENAVD